MYGLTLTARKPASPAPVTAESRAEEDEEEDEYEEDDYDGEDAE